jgi:MYXO-CTERM domain-containing protein
MANWKCSCRTADDPLSPDHLMLAAFGMGYTDERVQELMGQILKESAAALPQNQH